MKASTWISIAALVAGVAGSSANATLLFDNMTSAQAGAAGATISSTSSTPNTFMGDAFGLIAGSTDITGFDLYPVNATAATNYVKLRMNIFVWGGVNLSGTVNATTPAFSNLLASYTVTSATGTFTHGFYFPFESATPGVTPGITLGSPLVIPSNIIGITINVQGSTNGTTFASVNQLTSIISGGIPNDVGFNPLVNDPNVGAGVGGYYRNAASETNGNFVSTYRSFGGINLNMGMRIYGDAVPVPGAASLLGLAGLVATRRRRA